MHYRQALAMLSQLAHIFHIYERTGGICRSNRNQQSDGTENFWSQRAIFVMGWLLNHARTMPIIENIRSRSQPILKRDLNPRDQSRFTPCCRYWRLDATSACNDYACVKSFSDLAFVSSLFRPFSPRCQSIICVLPRYLYVCTSLCHRLFCLMRHSVQQLFTPQQDWCPNIQTWIAELRSKASQLSAQYP